MHQGTCCSASSFPCLFLEDVNCVSDRGDDRGLWIPKWQWLQWTCLHVHWQWNTWPTSSRRAEPYLIVAPPGCVNIAADLKAVLMKDGGYLWRLLSPAGSWNHWSSSILLTAWQASWSHWTKHCCSQPKGAEAGSSHPCCFYWLFFY